MVEQEWHHYNSIIRSFLGDYLTKLTLPLFCSAFVNASAIARASLSLRRGIEGEVKKEAELFAETASLIERNLQLISNVSLAYNAYATNHVIYGSMAHQGI